MSDVTPDISSNAINLRRLIVLRLIALAGQILAVWIAVTSLHLALPLRPLIGIIAAMALFNFLTWLRMQRPWPVAETELFAHLALDVAALTGLLYFSGGSTNPFVILYLLPLALTAAALPAGYAWAMVAVSMACYSLLMFYYVPLPHAHGDHDDFGLHVLGMWLGFLLSAALIAWFAVRMSETRRSRDRLLAQMREDELRNERIVALGTLAAGAAHELGTPLSTMAVLAKDMEGDAAAPPPMRANLRILREQIDRCKSILSSLSASAGSAVRAEGGRRVPLENYLADVVNGWQQMRRGVSVHRRFEGPRPSPEIIAEQTLSQAIVNILNNAADSSPDNVEIAAHWDERELVLEISDRGGGLTPDVARAAGQAFFTTKPPGQGLGLGLFLAHATLRRFGGTVRMYNREGGGACTRLVLPLANLRVDGAT